VNKALPIIFEICLVVCLITSCIPQSSSQHLTEQLPPKTGQEPTSVAQLATKADLIQALKDLEDRMTEKIDTDIDNTANTFVSVKDYWRVKRIADIVRAPLRVMEDTIGLLAKTADINGMAQAANTALDKSEAAYEVLSIIMMVQDLQQVGENLQCALDGPTYTSSIERMLEAADATFVPPTGDNWQKYYKQVIKNYLYGPINDSPIIIPRKSTTPERKNIEFVTSALLVRRSITQEFDNLITEIEATELPQGFPTSQVVSQIKELKHEMIVATGKGIDVHYKTYLGNQEVYVDTRLGGIGEYLKIFANVAMAVSKKLDIEIKVEWYKLAETGESAALIYTVSYGKPGATEFLKVTQKATVIPGIITSSYNRTFYTNSEAEFYAIPQEMVLLLPTELSNLWMIADDTDKYVRYLMENTAIVSSPVSSFTQSDSLDLSPGEIVVKWYSLLTNREYAEAEKLMSPNLLEIFKSEYGSMEAGWAYVEEAWTGYEKEGLKIERVEILDERISGDIAEVDFKLCFSNGTKQGLVTGQLIKINGEWKLEDSSAALSPPETKQESPPVTPSGSSTGALPSIAWSDKYPGNSYHPAYAVATDSKDNVIVGGASLYKDTYLLIKYRADGQEMWRKLPKEGTREVHAIATDSSDSIVLTQTVASYPDVSGGYEEYNLIKLDTNGNEIWRKTTGKNGKAVAVDCHDNSIAIGGALFYENEEHYYRYKSVVTKYDSQGNLLWESTDHDSGSVTDTKVMGVDIGSDGSVVAAGGAFLIKYDRNGNKLWEVSFSGEAQDVIVDSNDNIIVTGLGKLDETVGFATEGFITSKYNPGGQLLWERKYNSGNRSANGLALDSGNNIIIAGGFGVAGSNFMIIKYDPSGNKLWEEKNTNGYTAEAIAVDSKDNFIVTGSSNGNEGWYTAKYSQK
jgi:hypothetical protein